MPVYIEIEIPPILNILLDGICGDIYFYHSFLRECITLIRKAYLWTVGSVCVKHITVIDDMLFATAVARARQTGAWILPAGSQAHPLSVQ
jgi:hypothetical protein